MVSIHYGTSGCVRGVAAGAGKRILSEIVGVDGGLYVATAEYCDISGCGWGWRGITEIGGLDVEGRSYDGGRGK